MDPVTRELDLDDATLAENSRGAYPLSAIPNASAVMPPIARLTPEQAMYHFLSGYTAKVAGTEKGVTEPTATFSTCFGAPFLPLNPNVYAKQLGARIAKFGSPVW